MARVEANYAKALLSLAGDADEAERFGVLLAELADAVRQDAQLRTFLENPTLPKKAKHAVLQALAPKDAPAVYLRFLCLVADRGRTKLLAAIGDEYQRQQAAKGGECYITVTSAMPLDDAQAKRIAGLYARRCGASGAVLKTVVQPGLIGGVRVQVGDRMYDESLLGRMEDLRRAIGVI